MTVFLDWGNIYFLLLLDVFILTPYLEHEKDHPILAWLEEIFSEENSVSVVRFMKSAHILGCLQMLVCLIVSTPEWVILLSIHFQVITFCYDRLNYTTNGSDIPSSLEKNRIIKCARRTVSPWLMGRKSNHLWSATTYNTSAAFSFFFWHPWVIEGKGAS